MKEDVVCATSFLHVGKSVFKGKKVWKSNIGNVVFKSKKRVR